MRRNGMRPASQPGRLVIENLRREMHELRHRECVSEGKHCSKESFESHIEVGVLPQRQEVVRRPGGTGRGRFRRACEGLSWPVLRILPLFEGRDHSAAVIDSTWMILLSARSRPTTLTFCAANFSGACWSLSA